MPSTPSTNRWGATQHSTDGRLRMAVAGTWWFDAQAQVEKDGMSVSGDSIMGLLMLTAPRGSQITVTTSGPDAVALADALEALVTDYFGEGM